MKRFALVLAYTVLSSAILVGCGTGSSQKNGVQSAVEEVNEPATSIESEDTEEDNYIFTTKEEMESYFAETTITLGNWQEYVVIEEIENNDVDAFGDVRNYYTFCYMRQNPDFSGRVRDFAARVSYEQSSRDKYIIAETGEIYSDGDSGIRSDEVDIDSLYDGYGGDSIGTCTYCKEETTTAEGEKAYREAYNELTSIEVTKVKGTAYSYDIPEDKWNVDDDGKRFLAAHAEDGGLVFYYEDGGISGRSGSTSWEAVSDDSGNPLAWDLKYISE